MRTHQSSPSRKHGATVGTRNQLPEQQAFTYPDQQNTQQRRILSYDSQGRPIFARKSQNAPVTNQPEAIDIDLEVEEEEDEFYAQKPHTSVRRYDRPAAPAWQGQRVQAHPQQRIDIPPATQSPRKQRTAHPNQNRAQPPEVIYVSAKPSRFHVHWMIYVGVGIFLAAVIWYGSSSAVTWWYTTQNDVTYTQTFRTFSIDQVVGHNHDSTAHPSHFIVQNDKRHLVIIEFPADDMSKAIVYPAPYLIGAGQDRTPATITFIRNPQTHRLDMVLHVEDQTYVFFNDGKKFIPPTLQ